MLYWFFEAAIINIFLSANYDLYIKGAVCSEEPAVYCSFELSSVQFWFVFSFSFLVFALKEINLSMARILVRSGGVMPCLLIMTFGARHI